MLPRVIQVWIFGSSEDRGRLQNPHCHEAKRENPRCRAMEEALVPCVMFRHQPSAPTMFPHLNSQIPGVNSQLPLSLPPPRAWDGMYGKLEGRMQVVRMRSERRLSWHKVAGKEGPKAVCKDKQVRRQKRQVHHTRQRYTCWEVCGWWAVAQREVTVRGHKPCGVCEGVRSAVCGK